MDDELSSSLTFISLPEIVEELARRNETMLVATVDLNGHFAFFLKGHPLTCMGMVDVMKLELLRKRTTEVE